MDGGTVKFKFTADDSSLTKATSNASSSLSSLGSAAKTLGTALSVAVVAGAAAATTAIASLVSASVEAYAEFEQLTGGVETLFGDAAEEVMANANAAAAIGVSMNDYMSQVTSFAASLKQSTSDSLEAAEVADMAVTDMADNANKMGTSMELIQNAYQGFAKQNYTMLDNLKLGYGGTKEEMERLLADAEEISGITYDISNLSDVYNAIHVIQTELGITGTSAQEATETITGSISSLKATWENVKVYMAEGLPMGDVASDLATKITTVLDNVLPVVQQSIESIVDFIPEFLTQIDAYLPEFLTKGQEIIMTLFEGINNNISNVVSIIGQIMTTIINTIVQLLPTLLAVGVEILVAIINGIVAALPQLITALAEMLPTIIENLINGLFSIMQQLIDILPTIIPQIISAIIDALKVLNEHFDEFLLMGAQIILGIIEGLIKSIPDIIANLPTIITAILNFFTVSKLLSAGTALLKGLGNGLIKGIPELIKKIPQIITSMITTFKEKGLSGFADIGGQLVKGLWNGIKNVKDWVLDRIKGFGKSILNGIKSIFGISSPSKEFAWVGRMNMEGLVVGTEEMEDQVYDAYSNILNADEMFDLSPSLYGTASNNLSPSVNVSVYNNLETDPLGQVVNSIKTFSGGAKNDYNYGMGV